jgi:hypothetical protein
MRDMREGGLWVCVLCFLVLSLISFVAGVWLTRRLSIRFSVCLHLFAFSLFFLFLIAGYLVLRGFCGKGMFALHLPYLLFHPSVCMHTCLHPILELEH